MTVLFPEAVKAMGNTSVTVVQTIADTNAPTLTEINAATSVNVSCFLFTGSGAATATTNTGDAPARLCSTQTFQELGNTSYSVGDLQYVYDPQAEDTDDANKARTALTPGSEVYLVYRYGMSAQEVPYAADQKVDIWKVRLGPQNKTQTGDGEFDQLSITQSVVVTAPPVTDVPIAAAGA